MPLYLQHKYQANNVFQSATSVLAIHNLAHQGTALAAEFPLFNLPPHAYPEMEWIYEEPDGRRTPVRPLQHASPLPATPSCPRINLHQCCRALPCAARTPPS